MHSENCVQLSYFLYTIKRIKTKKNIEKRPEQRSIKKNQQTVREHDSLSKTYIQKKILEKVGLVSIYKKGMQQVKKKVA